jgi:type I restriction enzyme, R subunit
MREGNEGVAEQFPTPEELWNLTLAETNEWRDRFAAVPFEDKGGYFQGRYYEDLAIQKVIKAIAADKQRILLTLATGTGKTFIAFQIAWKLFHSRIQPTMRSPPPYRFELILDVAARSRQCYGKINRRKAPIANRETTASPETATVANTRCLRPT